ncbi:hypothetical protein Tco_0498871 [Tanacetum coccineum]
MIVISEDEDAAEDSPKQGRKISDIDTDPTILLVQHQQDMEYDFDISTTEGFTTSISTVSPPRVSTAEDISGAETLVYIRRSASKANDKGKAIMQKSEPPKKIKKRVQAKQEQERIDLETALELQKKLDKREEVLAKEVHDIDWSDPSVLRYHALQNRPFSVAEVRKNMCMYLKNQGGYKMSHFKGMSYEEIRPIFEKVRDQIQTFVPMDSEKEKEDDAKKEELQVYLNIIPEEESLDVESLATKQDVLELYRLVKDRFQTASLEGYEIWRNQQDWNLINWKLHNFGGIHMLLMDNGLVIHMMVEKKYPLSQDTLSKMLSRRLEVDHQSEMGYELIRFVKSQVL